MKLTWLNIYHRATPENIFILTQIKTKYKLVYTFYPTWLIVTEVKRYISRTLYQNLKLNVSELVFFISSNPDQVVKMSWSSCKHFKFKM